MSKIAVAIALTLLVGAVVVYVARFIGEYRKIKRELDAIRSAGRTRSAIRRWRREAGATVTKKTSGRHDK